MASLEESLLASALETLNIDDYWPSDDDQDTELDHDNDGEYPIILYFYESLFDQVISTYDVNRFKMKKAFKRLKITYKRLSNSENLNFGSLANCCGYLHLYAACHTGLVRKSLLDVFHTNPPAEVRRMLCLKSSLKVMSLGGGPGNCMIGFCSALYGKHYGLADISLTVVDSMPGWSFILDNTETMLRSGDFGCLSRMFNELDVKTSFLMEDLIGPSWSQELKELLVGADVVMMVKTLSVLKEFHQAYLLANTVVRMKPGALLIFIDSPFPDHLFGQTSQYLDLIYHRTRQSFHFEYGVTRFDYMNIRRSSAHVYVYVKKFKSTRLT